MDTDIHKAKILIVDDHGPNVLLLNKLLKMNGFHNIVETVDVREVFSLYHREQPDLILLDLKMPYMDGFDILEQFSLYEREPYTPIIVITSHDEIPNRDKAYMFGVQDFIAKPFDVKDVIHRIQNALKETSNQT
ncbi:response regulator [Pontibacillus marinus]|uniref:Response regulatory domain-containing protein n=1 Tax=Pontibacillus marinus BH030004 = DSM 16465 TaxID=1385511 RepID=A0A0A5FXK0_9BACI|nr:response regulator [Pontibacillus marinus]KGX83548.1 hypothetical protein N783_02745 [Pontibacillus marinus BH030004 = DSM 16465]